MLAYIGIFKEGTLITKISNSIDFYYKKEYINAMEYLCYLYESYLKEELLKDTYIAWDYCNKKG